MPGCRPRPGAARGQRSAIRAPTRPGRTPAACAPETAPTPGKPAPTKRGTTRAPGRPGPAPAAYGPGTTAVPGGPEGGVERVVGKQGPTRRARRTGRRTRAPTRISGCRTSCESRRTPGLGARSAFRTDRRWMERTERDGGSARNSGQGPRGGVPARSPAPATPRPPGLRRSPAGPRDPAISRSPACRSALTRPRKRTGRGRRTTSPPLPVTSTAPPPSNRRSRRPRVAPGSRPGRGTGTDRPRGPTTDRPLRLRLPRRGNRAAGGDRRGRRTPYRHARFTPPRRHAVFAVRQTDLRGGVPSPPDTVEPP